MKIGSVTEIWTGWDRGINRCARGVVSCLGRIVPIKYKALIGVEYQQQAKTIILIQGLVGCLQIAVLGGISMPVLGLLGLVTILPSTARLIRDHVRLCHRHLSMEDRCIHLGKIMLVVASQVVAVIFLRTRILVMPFLLWTSAVIGTYGIYISSRSLYRARLLPDTYVNNQDKFGPTVINLLKKMLKSGRAHIVKIGRAWDGQVNHYASRAVSVLGRCTPAKYRHLAAGEFHSQAKIVALMQTTALLLQLASLTGGVVGVLSLVGVVSIIPSTVRLLKQHIALCREELSPEDQEFDIDRVFLPMMIQCVGLMCLSFVKSRALLPAAIWSSALIGWYAMHRTSKSLYEMRRSPDVRAAQDSVFVSARVQKLNKVVQNFDAFILSDPVLTQVAGKCLLEAVEKEEITLRESPPEIWEASDDPLEHWVRLSRREIFLEGEIRRRKQLLWWYPELLESIQEHMKKQPDQNETPVMRGLLESRT